MDIEREKAKLEKALATAKAKLEAATQRRKAAKQRLRSQEVQAKDKAEKWHRFRLAHHLREAGYNGEHATALMALRALPFEKYVEYLRTQASQVSEPLIVIEYRFVNANLAGLNEAGNKRLLERDKARYHREQQKWNDWQQANPDALSWRTLKPSKQQAELVMRIVEADGVTMPDLVTRGAAHDWISAHGGNPRLER